MRVTRIKIENFRSIRHLTVDLGDTTVFVGPNNAGKTAILDALRIVLTRRWGQRGSGFNEYDIHLVDDKAEPKTSTGVSIELRSEESEPGEWSDTIAAYLADIMQLDMITGCRFVALRTRYEWVEKTSAFESSWDFLDAKRRPLSGNSAGSVNLRSFRHCLPVFYLGALRDAGDEFSSRSSQFWQQLLKALDIPPEIESEALEALDQINRSLLEADPRLREIAGTLSRATRIATHDQEGNLDLRMVPLKTRDLLSRANIVLRNDLESPLLPLRRQGQGIQSLSVIFLFQAFVEHLLKELHASESVPVLALEEPETHLHPQAVRTLWHHVSHLSGQKIITTHSPYFVQHVPFRDLRFVRLTENGTEVRSLPASFSASIPPLDGLEKVVKKSNGSLSYAQASETLTVHGKLDEEHFRALLCCCATDERRPEFEQRLRDLKDRSSLYIDDDELRSLETCARRMRGEIFFSRHWLIVEGQTEYPIMYAMAHALGYDLDQHGVSVIDVQNNGSPAVFVALAQALDISWLAVFDGDSAGLKYVKKIEKRISGDTELRTRCRTHSAGNLEKQLLADGLGPELREILVKLNVQNAHRLNDEDLVKCLRDKKTAYAAELAVRIHNDTDLAQRALESFRETIEELRGLV